MSVVPAIRAPRGGALTCKGWHQEAALRMLHNNLDPDVAEKPDELIVYGGTGRAARSWEAFHAIVRALRSLENDETLLVQSGRPVGIFRTTPEAPRVLIANSNLVGHWSNWDEFNRLERLGLTMYGQMTAGSWIYIGSQGIVQGRYETFAAVARRHFGGSLAGKLVVSGGMGGMGGAQPLAAVMNGACFLGIDVDPARIKRRLETGYCDRDGDEPRRALRGARRGAGARRSDLGRPGGQLRRRGAGTGAARHRPRRAHRPDQRARSAEWLRAARHDARSGGGAASGRSGAYVERSTASMGVHVEAMLELQKRGAVTFDYGNNIRTQAKKAGVSAPSTSPASCPSTYGRCSAKGRGPFRWVALSGDPADIARTDRLALELFPARRNAGALAAAGARAHPFPRAAGAHLLAGLRRARRIRRGHQPLVRSGELKAPIVIGRDHLDAGSVASPFRETEAMRDGSDASPIGRCSTRW
jgi:urocanate hydratase